jgi:glycerol-3-phosphate acyltransferase PlsY
VFLYFILLVIGAYLLGSIPTAYLVARWRRGIDIRRFGSGNVGITNVLASGSRWSSLIVFVFDLLKGAFPVFLARNIGLQPYQWIIVGLAAICGHNWTIFLRFSGGRGILTTLGVILAIAPWLALTMLVLNFLFAPFRQFAVGTLVVLVLIPLLSWLAPNVFAIEKSAALSIGFVAILLLAVVRRLTAPRSEFAVTVSTGELMANRLLFDRDIRDRSTWLKRGKPTNQV